MSLSTTLLETILGKRIVRWETEHTNVRRLSLEGKTLLEIGSMYGVSRARILQVLNKYYPTLEASDRGVSLRAKLRDQEIVRERFERTGRTTGRHQTDLSRAMMECFRRKRQNAKRGKWGWDIAYTDIEYPLVCPILGITLDWFSEYMKDDCPSFDRLDSTKGYVKGNVIICSLRANRLKNNGTANEHRQIADFLDKFTKT